MNKHFLTILFTLALINAAHSQKLSIITKTDSIDAVVKAYGQYSILTTKGGIKHSDIVKVYVHGKVPTSIRSKLSKINVPVIYGPTLITFNEDLRFFQFRLLNEEVNWIYEYETKDSYKELSLYINSNPFIRINTIKRIDEHFLAQSKKLHLLDILGPFGFNKYNCPNLILYGMFEFDMRFDVIQERRITCTISNILYYPSQTFKSDRSQLTKLSFDDAGTGKSSLESQILNLDMNNYNDAFYEAAGHALILAFEQICAIEEKNPIDGK